MVQQALKRRTFAFSAGLFLCALVVFLYLNRPLPEEIKAADFTCLQSTQGVFTKQFPKIKRIFGIGLSYANHINETASSFNSSSSPPVFVKSLKSLNSESNTLILPDRQVIEARLTDLDKSLPSHLDKREIEIETLLDYEVELAFILLEDINVSALDAPDYIPKLGFLLVNDFSARSIAVLGEGQVNRFDYWGASKGFEGFTPIESRIWLANRSSANGIPCVHLKTEVNGEIRQYQNTRNLIYTPNQMLKFIAQSPYAKDLKKGDLVLTGTPGGVVLNVPRWKSRIAQILGLDRFTKLSMLLKESSAKQFLQAGDKVVMHGEWLGSVETHVVAD